MSIYTPHTPEKIEDRIFKTLQELSSIMEAECPAVRAGRRSEKLTKQFNTRLEVEAMFITLAQMWGFTHPETVDEHLKWLQDVMELGTNAIYNNMKKYTHKNIRPIKPRATD